MSRRALIFCWLSVVHFGVIAVFAAVSGNGFVPGMLVFMVLVYGILVFMLVFINKDIDRSRIWVYV